MDLTELYLKTANKLAKWRNVFASWQHGKFDKGNHAYDAIAEHREATLLLRAELTALVGIILSKNIATLAEIQHATIAEFQAIDKDLEKRFPGLSTSEHGIEVDTTKVTNIVRNPRHDP